MLVDIFPAYSEVPIEEHLPQTVATCQIEKALSALFSQAGTSIGSILNQSLL